MLKLQPRWRKVLRDLWLNKSRTLLVVLSVAVGVFAVGTIATSQIVLSRDLTNTYLATHPAHATIYTMDAFDRDLVKSVDAMREVKEAEARRAVSLRLNTGPDEWRLLWLVAIDDFSDISIDQIASVSGDWPPPDHEMLIERASLGLTNAGMGDTVLVKTPDGKERHMRIAGLAHDLNGQIFVFDGTAYGFTTAETLKWLGQEHDYNELRFRVTDPACAEDRACIQEVSNKVRDKIEASGRTIFFTLIPEPGKPPLDFLIQAISVILGALGFLSLLLSGFLVVNTISALLTQQTRQIGMMKAVGARTDQISGMYLVTVLLFGLLALLIAIPLGVVGAYGFSRLIAGFMNFDVTSFRLPLNVLLLQVGVGLVIPLLAAVYPVLMGVRVTVREAISAYGLGKGRFGSGLLDRLLIKVQRVAPLRRHLTRPLLISLRNTFRRKGRLIMTLITLTLGGAIFISVFSVRASLLTTLDAWLDYFQYDVGIQLDRSYRIERLRRDVKQVPGVIDAEGWAFTNARRLRPDGTDSDNIILFAPPADTKLVKPILTGGRWLASGDFNAVVVNTLLLRDEPDLALGDSVTLKIEGKERDWKIVGIVQGGSMAPTAFVNHEYYAHITSEIGQGDWLFVATERHDQQSQERVAREIERRFERTGVGVSLIAVVAQERAEAEAMFEVIVVLLLLMAVLLAVIGGLGLMGTMSINVLERTREIGVMRAIGASNRSVQQIFIVEGVLIGLLSWLAGVLLAVPISQMLSHVVGAQFLNAPLDYDFSTGGALAWLVVVIVLAALASFLPAWNASRLTVQEVLAYE